MSNLVGYQGVADRLAAVNAMHGETAMRLIEARERIEGKSARAAFLHPASRASLSLLNNLVGDMPVHNPSDHIALTPAQEAELCAQLDARVQKILAIVAIMINDAGADIAEMEALLDMIRVLDRDFFDFAEEPAEEAPEPVKRKAMRYYYYCGYFTSWLKAFREEEGLVTT